MARTLLLFTVLFSVLLWHPSEAESQTLHLNEIMASNNATLADEDGDFEDWIEIYNSGDESVDLLGYGLSDDYDRPFRWEFPDTTIQAGEFMLVWASNKNRTDLGGELHTNYAISSAGEEVLLTNPDGNRIDELPPTEIPTDISLGRQPDGTGDWFYFPEPTPGQPNTTDVLEDLLDEPEFSHQPGFYTGDFNLEISHPDEAVTIYYTLDGSEPTSDSQVYSGPIPITNRTDEPNVLSTIPTNFLDGWRRFREPTRNIKKGTVIRTLAVKTGFKPAVTSNSYFVFPDGQNAHTLPVVSISTDSTNLFGHEEGIFVPGKYYQEGVDHTGNYYQRGIEWEREASLEFFDEKGDLKLAQNVGLRIHGGFSRRWQQKSLRIYARNQYGENRINYQIFPDLEDDSFNRLLLRNSGNDQSLTMFRDAAAHLAVNHLDMDTQAYRPAVVYINGEYWGILNFRERYDKHYLERVYGIDPDNIDLLTGHWDIKEVDNQQYASFLNFLDREGLADDNNLEHANTLIDLDNLLDYYSAQVYFVNTDWPHNNIDFWRSQVPYDENAPTGHDGRWRWLFYDIDFTFGLVQSYNYNMLSWVTRETVHNMEWPNLILRNLLENESFKHDFINRMADQLNTAFQPDRVVGIMDSLQKLIEPEMENYGHRWHYPTSLDNWQSFIDPMIEFAENRPYHLRQNILNHFDISSKETISVTNLTPQKGTVWLNSIAITPETPGISDDPYPWSGTYFSGVPVTFQAEPKPGFVFSRWIVDGEEFFEKNLTLHPEEFSSAKAVFEAQSLENFESHVVADTTYMFVIWDDDEPVGTYPESMTFVYMNEPEPGLDASVAGITTGTYNLDSRTRINGLGDYGFAFINTSNLEGNPGFPGRQLGGAVLALDTRGIESAEVGWMAGTVRPNSRVYNLRLQYRIGSEGEFRDIINDQGNPVEYQRNEEEGHTEFIGPVDLPEDAIGHERVELLWRYYFTGERLDEDSGQRSKLNISFIHVSKITDQNIPEPHDLSVEDYHFSEWPEDSPKGTAPPSMEFVYMDKPDPGLDASVLGATAGRFDLESRARVNGLGEDGFAFINTSNLEGNPGYPGRRLGGAILALNTEGRGSITVDWTAGTVLPNSRVYNLRLQYRTDPDEPFRDLLEEDGQPIEYERNINEGHRLPVEPVVLPSDAEDQPNVQLLWRYYYTGERTTQESGQRSQLHISEINVTSFALMGSEPGAPEDFALFQNYPNPFYPHTTIRYDLPLDQHVQIDLYTVTGQHIARVEDRQAEAGRHSVEVDASSLASGIYIYRMSTELFNETGKMSIIK